MEETGLDRAVRIAIGATLLPRVSRFVAGLRREGGVQTMGVSGRRRHTRAWVVLGLSVVLVVATARAPSGQYRFRTGRTIAPSFEGWERNPDGTFNMVFGYLNRNYEEVLDIPVGPNNHVEPGGPDQGQPTHFFPRRRQFVFRVTVRADFGNKEVVWSLTTRGNTERAYGTLAIEYELDKRVIMMNNAGVSQRGSAGNVNEWPVVRVRGDTRTTVKVGEPLTLTAFAADDGVPSSDPESTGRGRRRRVYGLRVGWFVYRGAGQVAFDPEQIIRVYPQDYVPPPLPADGIFTTRATFSEPGPYVLRVMADDIGLQMTRDVHVTVVP